MATRKGVGGPKSEDGKAKSSLNAIKFGVSTFRAVDDEEKQLIDAFAKELIQFYKPDSPLEVMQLERIALCRAKLARLYEIERNRLQLAKNAIEASPKKILDQLTASNDLVKKLAQEQIDYGAMNLPLNLTIQVLEAISQELESIDLYSLTEKNLKRHIPSLHRYLKDHAFIGIDADAPVLEKLQWVLQRLKKIIESDNPPIGKIAQLLEKLLDQDPTSKQAKHQDNEDVRSLMLELNPNYEEPTEELPSKKTQIDTNQILLNLRYFSDLLEMVRQPQKLMMHYEQSKALIVKSLVLPQAEADLLLRYQTTWERRLSTEVGEFIELRKYGRA